MLTVVSAVAATMVIRKINHMQTTRRWVPWWDQGEPKLSAVPSYEVTQVPSYANDDTDEQPAISEPIAAGPSLGLVREPQLEMAGAAQAGNPFAPTPAPAPQAPVQNPFAPQGFPGDGAAAPAAFAGGPASGDAPKWSPFAPGAENWQDDEAGPATEQFNPIETWRDEKPVEETTYEAPQQSWEDYRSSVTADVLGTTSTTSSWRDEAAPMTVVQPDPYAYQPEPEPQPQPQPAEEPWAARYSEPYSYESDYLTSTASPVEAQTAPEPEPAPVARAGRRAARVAVDSPSAIQPAVPSPSTHAAEEETYSSYSDHNVYGQSEHTQPSSHVSASSGYYEPAPAPSYQEQDDFLTPSKPLPPVPSYGPEPTYSSGDSYSSQETSYTSDYASSYNSESYNSSNYEYDAYNGNGSNGSNGGSEYTSTESYETYSPNYATESYGSQYSPEPEQTEYQQQTPYAYEQDEQQPTEPEQPTSPRTQPRRGRWI